jgi:hypothetical protein
MVDEFDALSTAIDQCIKPGGSLCSDYFKIVMYFDESHVLSEKSASFDRDHKKSLMDVLCAAVNHLRSRPFFVIFLSTNSHLHSLAPSGHFAKSAQAREHWESLQAPITEVPFDCTPNLDVDADVMTLADTSTLEFMARRPL